LKHSWLLKNSFSRKCSGKLCARMPYKRRSQFSGHFLSPHFGAIGAKLDFFNTHSPSKKRRKTLQMTSKPGSYTCSGISMGATYLLPMRCPAYRRHDSYLGSRRELENRVGDEKGKRTSGRTTRPKVPMHWAGTDCFVVVRKRGNSRGAKGAGHPHWDGVNGQPEELLVLMEGGSLL